MNSGVKLSSEVKTVKIVKKSARGKTYYIVTLPKDFVREIYGDVDVAGRQLTVKLIEYEGKKAIVYIPG